MLLNCGVEVKTLESALDCKEIKPVNPKGNQSWMFIGRTDAEAEAPALCPPDAKNWISGRDTDAGKDVRQQEKGETEDEIVGWHHWLKGHESEQNPGDGEADCPILCPPDAKSQLIGKDPDAGKDWRQKEKGVAEDEMVR